MAATTLTAVAAKVVSVTATPETTVVATAALRAATVTANATESPRNDGARGRAPAIATRIASHHQDRAGASLAGHGHGKQTLR